MSDCKTQEYNITWFGLLVTIVIYGDIGTIDNMMVFFLLPAPYIDRSPIQKG